MVKAAEESFHHDYVILDCASGTNICKSENHASSIRPCIRGSIVGIDGAVGGTHYDRSCTFVDAALGRMPLAPEASANIVSLAVARDKGFSADYRNERDEFTLVSPLGNRYVFGRLTESIGEPRKFYVMDLDTQTPPSDNSTLARLPTYATEPSGTTNPSIATNSTPTQPSPQTQPCHVPTAQAVAIEHDAILHQLSDHRTGSAQNHASTRRDQVGQISLFRAGDLLFTTILMLPMLYSFTLLLADQSAEAISAALDKTQRGAAMNGFHLRWSHANSAPAWSASEVGRLLLSCAIPITAGSQHSKRHATRVERRIDLIKDQYLLLRSSTSMLTTTELIIAANTQVNLRTDHISQPGSSPTDRFVGH